MNTCHLTVAPLCTAKYDAHVECQCLRNRTSGLTRTQDSQFECLDSNDAATTNCIACTLDAHCLEAVAHILAISFEEFYNTWDVNLVWFGGY